MGRKALYVNVAHTARFEGGKRAAAGVSVRAPDKARVRVPLSLGAELDCILGQQGSAAQPYQ